MIINFTMVNTNIKHKTADNRGQKNLPFQFSILSLFFKILFLETRKQVKSPKCSHNVPLLNFSSPTGKRER